MLLAFFNFGCLCCCVWKMCVIANNNFDIWCQWLLYLLSSLATIQSFCFCWRCCCCCCLCSLRIIAVVCLFWCVYEWIILHYLRLLCISNVVFAFWLCVPTSANDVNETHTNEIIPRKIQPNPRVEMPSTASFHVRLPSVFARCICAGGKSV